MRRKWLYVGILSYCIVLLVILIIGSAKNNTDYSGKTIQSALLNQKYKNTINKIMIKFPLNENDNHADNEYQGYVIPTLVFTKKNTDGNEYWQGNVNGVLFKADTSVLQKFLVSSCKTQDFILLSDDISSWKQFELTDQEAVQISFYESSGGNDTLRSDLFFGKSTADYSGVYVRNGKNASVYRIDNVFSPYLSQNIDLWADLSVLPTELLNWKIEKESDAMSVSVTQFDKNNKSRTVKLYENGSSEYSEYIHTLLSVKGSSIVSLDDVVSLGINQILSIQMTNQKMQSASVAVFSTGEVSEPDTRFYTQFKTDKETSYPDYFIEISSWTYKNLLPQSFM